MRRATKPREFLKPPKVSSTFVRLTRFRGQRQAIELAESIAERQHFEMTFRRGDIQLLNNYVCLHTRNAYVDWPDPERKRRLWRLWLSDPELRPATAYVRQWDAGVVLRATEDRIVL